MPQETYEKLDDDSRWIGHEDSGDRQNGRIGEKVTAHELRNERTRRLMSSGILLDG